MLQLQSGCGLLVFIALAWCLCADRRNVNWRLVGKGLCMQFVLAALILYVPPVRFLFSRLGEGIEHVIGFSQYGTAFLLGEGYPKNFATTVLPAVIFMSALCSLLFYLRIIQAVVWVLSWITMKILGTSGVETLCAFLNVFIGQTEAPLGIKKYLTTMTRSELFSMKVGGYATIAGSLLAAFIAMGIDAVHLLCASVISAPAALVVAKIMQPECEKPETLGGVHASIHVDDCNALHALASGTTTGVKLALNVGAMVMVFVALLPLIDSIVIYWGKECGQDWCIEKGLGYLFAPFAWLMGVTSTDCTPIGQLLGTRMFANEVVSYMQLTEWMRPDSSVQLASRSVTLATYALCGFANFVSMGIQIAGIRQLVPKRDKEIAQLALRAMLGGTLVTMMTASVVGMMIQ